MLFTTLHLRAPHTLFVPLSRANMRVTFLSIGPPRPCPPPLPIPTVCARSGRAGAGGETCFRHLRASRMYAKDAPYAVLTTLVAKRSTDVRRRGVDGQRADFPALTRRRRLTVIDDYKKNTARRLRFCRNTRRRRKAILEPSERSLTDTTGTTARRPKRA